VSETGDGFDGLDESGGTGEGTGGSGGAATATRGTHRGSGRGRTDVVLLGLRGVGQTLITLGLVILLFVVYEVWVTNIFAAAAQRSVHKSFEQKIVAGDNPLVAATQAALPGSQQATIPTGTGIANSYMPRLGDDYHFTIVEGTNDADLDKGPGHYAGTALPGQVGNFSVAGHRVGKGEPFLNLDQLRPGDAIVIETVTAWYVYTVIGDASAGENGLSTPGIEGVVGREIVNPSDVGVIAPVPDHPGTTPTAALLTLTTCHPKFTANKRMIVHASLTRTVPRSGDQVPKELTGGTL
jgi:sortase A